MTLGKKARFLAYSLGLVPYCYIVEQVFLGERMVVGGRGWCWLVVAGGGDDWLVGG